MEANEEQEELSPVARALSQYDESVRSTTLYIFVRVGNATTNDRDFVDTRMVCIRPKEVARGSRVPENAGQMLMVNTGLVLALAAFSGIAVAW